MLQLAIPEDTWAINALAREVHAMHVAWRPDIYEMVDNLYTEERVSTAIKCRELYTAKIDNTVIGYVSVKARKYEWPGVVKRKVMFVDELCVSQPFRGQGIGKAMMEDVKALARAFGCTDLQLGVYPQNDTAVSFYQKCGLTIRSIDMQMKL